MFILFKDYKHEGDAENIVKWVFFLICSKASSIALASAVNIVATSGSRTENMSFMTTASVELVTGLKVSKGKFEFSMCF